MAYATKNLAPKTLTETEQRQLLACTASHAAGLRDHVIFALALASALREHEILALNVADLFDGRGRARKHVELRVFKTSNKDDSQQHITLSDRIREKLEKLLAQLIREHGADSITADSPVFVSREGNRLSERMLRHAFGVWQERAGFERRFTFHALRHTACTNLYRATKDIRMVQRFARHASVLSTQIYTHSSDDELVRAVNNLPC